MKHARRLKPSSRSLTDILVPTGPRGQRCPADAIGNAVKVMRIATGDAPEAFKGRHSPSECVGALKAPVQGGPDRKHISTSFA